MYAIKQVELAIRAHLDDLLGPSGITALQYTALTVLRRRDGLAAAELARNSFVTPQSMADLIRVLEQRGWIQRRRDEGNRRRLLISLTPAGRELLAEYDGKVQALEEEMLAPLSRAEQDAFRRFLNVTRHALNSTPPH
jgi:DNA-binding MarR family transcriptional regulator